MPDRPSERTPIWFPNTYRTKVRVQFPVLHPVTSRAMLVTENEAEIALYSILNPTVGAITNSNDGRSLVCVVWSFKKRPYLSWKGEE